MNKQKGYTLTELLALIVVLLGIFGVVMAAYAAFHFITKYW